MIMSVMAFLLTLAAILTGVQLSAHRPALEALVTDARGMVQDLLGYTNLTHLGQFGVFDAQKVLALTENNLSWDFQPSFAYQVSIIDRSPYGTHYNNTIESAPVPLQKGSLQVGIDVQVAPIDIWVNANDVRAGALEVTVWE